MVFVFCVLCIIVYCAEKFWDLYTKNGELSHSEATIFLHATRKFWLVFPPKILNLPERKTKIVPSSVKWQISSEAQCFENAQKFFSTVKTPWKLEKTPWKLEKRPIFRFDRKTSSSTRWIDNLKSWTRSAPSLPHYSGRTLPSLQVISRNRPNYWWRAPCNQERHLPRFNRSRRNQGRIRPEVPGDFFGAQSTTRPQNEIYECFIENPTWV